MSQQTINVGTLPNDLTGDPLRTAFTKVNTNFNEIYTKVKTVTNGSTIGNTPSQVIFETPATLFRQTTMQINVTNPTTGETQNSTLVAFKNYTNALIIYNQSLSFQDGSILTSFAFDIVGVNVRLLSSPVPNNDLQYLIMYQIDYEGDVQ